MNLRTNDYVFYEQTMKIGMHEFKLFHSITLNNFFFLLVSLLLKRYVVMVIEET